MRSTADIVEEKAVRLAAPDSAGESHRLLAAVSHLAEMSGYPAVMIIEGAFDDPSDILTMDVWRNVSEALVEVEKCLESTSLGGLKRLRSSLTSYVSSVLSIADSNELKDAFCLVYYASQCLKAATQQALPEFEISFKDRMPGRSFSDSREVYLLVSKRLISSGNLETENEMVSEELSRLALLLDCEKYKGTGHL